MARNPALIDLHLFLTKTKVAQVKIRQESLPVKSKNDLDNIVDNTTIQS